MKIFVDSANLHDIEEALKRGFTSGITTNPSILSKEQRRDFNTHIRDIIALVRKYEVAIPLSVELFTTDTEEMLRQADGFLDAFGDYEELAIKVPIGWDELRVIHHLRRRGAKVNCTCCMSYNQAIMASRAGANYVSLFWGRIRDTGYDAASVVRQVHQTFREWNSPSEIIVGSIRQMIDVSEAIQAGADIVTVPPKFFELMCKHPKTDEAVGQFIRDFREWNSDEAASTELMLAGAAGRYEQNSALQFSGIYEDGWVSANAFLDLAQSADAAQVAVQGMVPQIDDPSFSTTLHVLVDGNEVGQRALTLGAFELAAPVSPRVGTRRIELRFSATQSLPGADHRPVAALLRSTAISHP